MKRILLATVAVLSASIISLSGASAQYVGSGQAGAPANNKATVADVLKNGFDDQRVILRGQVLRRIAGDKYIFSDGTGEIRVDIDDDEWPRESITDKTNLEIIGKVDTEWNRSMEIDVKVLRIVR